MASDDLDLNASRQAFLRSIAETENWTERCARVGEADYGCETEEEIQEYTASAQADLDYLTEQNNMLERWVKRARTLLTDEAPAEFDEIRELVEKISGIETWEERCRREAEADYGCETEEEIQEHIASAQTDLDYLTEQDSKVEQLIKQTRVHLGIEEKPEDTCARFSF